MLSLQPFTAEDTLGALNLYSLQEDAFDETARVEALALAAHVAVALAAARQIGQMRVAIEGRTVIGQAEGILMERFDLTAAKAFAALVRVSSVTNRKLLAVATEIVDTRRIPTAEQPGPDSGGLPTDPQESVESAPD